MIGKGWKEAEKFIDDKIKGKALTTAEENELYELREWLKFSDQELALPYDAMKRKMDKALTADPPKETPTPTVIRPFSPRY